MTWKDEKKKKEKSSVRLIKKKEKGQINKIRNLRVKVITNIIEIQSYFA